MIADDVDQIVESLVTDDEVVALVSLAGLHFEEGLGTVDVSDAAELDRAAARGVRSLLVRGMVSVDGAVLAGAAAAVRGLSSSVRLRAAFVDEGMVPLASEDHLALRRAADGVWISETTRPGGVRRYAGVDMPEAVALTAAILEARAQATDGPAYCVVVFGPAGEAVGGVLAKSTTLLPVSFSPSGELDNEADGSEPVSDVQCYLERLLDAS